MIYERWKENYGAFGLEYVFSNDVTLSCDGTKHKGQVKDALDVFLKVTKHN